MWITKETTMWPNISVSTLLILVCCAMPGCGSSEQDAPAPPPIAESSNANAAYEYRRLPDVLGEDLLQACRSVKNEGSLDGNVLWLLQDRQSAIGELISATSLEFCDFETDHSIGMEVEVPHLADLRAMERVLCADALRVAGAGDERAAAERLSAAVRLAIHTTEGEPIMISVLVGFSMIDRVSQVVGDLIGRGLLGRDARQMVAVELNRINIEDPLGAKSVLPLELRGAVISLRKTSGFDATGEVDYSRITPAERETAIREITRAFDEIERVWDTRNAVAEMGRIRDRLSSPLARWIVGPFMPCREQAGRAKTMLRELIETLES